MLTHNLFGYIDVFPQHQVHAGRKCIILSEFEKHNNFPMLKGKTVDCVITSLSSGAVFEHRCAILDFQTWVIGHPNHYGLILPLDFPLDKCSVVSLAVTIPDLGGV